MLPLQAIPGIPELLIIAMIGTMILGAVFIIVTLIQGLRAFREGYRDQ